MIFTSRISVFSAAADGDVIPVRHIQPKLSNGAQFAQSYLVAVDNLGNLYAAASDGAIYVFRQQDDGAVAPTRTIAGPRTLIIGNSYGVNGMATDAAGNLYVLGRSTAVDGANAYRVQQFTAGADGDVAPIRYVTTPGMADLYEMGGVAVDGSGTVYVSAYTGPGPGFGLIIVFPATASGSVTPSVIMPWAHGQSGQLAVH